MRFKLDQNIPSSIAAAVAAEGHDVHTAAEEGLSSASDPVLLAACVSEGWILVTLDRDFADIRAYPPGTHAGLWVLRPPRQTVAAVAAVVAGGLRLARVERVEGRLWVLDEMRVRIRGE